MEPITTLLVGTLASKGFSFLKDLLTGATDTAADKAKQFIEEKTGIPLVDSTGDSSHLTNDQLLLIAQTIEENKVELAKLVVEDRTLYNQDVSNAREMQTKKVEAFVEVAKTGNKEALRALWLPTNFIYLYALLITLAGIAFMFVSFLVDNIPENRFQFITQSMGVYQNVLLILVGFFFGGAYEKSKAENGARLGASESQNALTGLLDKYTK